MSTKKPNVQSNATFTIVLVEDNNELSKLIKSIHGRGKTLQQDMHRAACSILHKVVSNGDVRTADRFINELIDAMPKAARINALKAWFEHFGPISFDGKGDKAQYRKRENAADMLPKAMATPFWVFQPEPPYQPVDLEKAITQLVKRLEKDETEIGANHTEAKQLLNEFLAKRARNTPLGTGAASEETSDEGVEA